MSGLPGDIVSTGAGKIINPAETKPAETTETKPAETKPAETTTETKPAETKPEEKKAEVKPITLDSLKLPDGVKLDDNLSKEFFELVNNNALDSQSRAQALLDLHLKTVNAASEKGSQLWEQQQEQWTTEAKADPIIGGDKLEPALGSIARLLDKYAVGADGKPDAAFKTKLLEAMDTTGAGNHPAVIRLLAGIAKELALEGTPVSGDPGSQPRDAASIMFPNQGKA